MVILGSIEKQRQISEGQFFCQKCNNISPFKRQRASSYFTFFFIPLIKIKTLADYVECQVCKSYYGPKILEPGSQQLLKMEAISKYSLKRGSSLDDVKVQLIEAGADEEIAEKIIERVMA
jgi:zinc-ribbon family